MTSETRNELAATAKGLLRLGDKTLVVRTPTDADSAFFMAEFRRLAKLKCRSPLAALADEWASLPPEMKAMAMREAVGQKAGGDSEPTVQQIGAQFYEPEGCRVVVWWLARDDHPDLQLADLEKLITQDTVIAVLADLARATGVDRAFPNSDGRTSSPPG